MPGSILGTAVHRVEDPELLTGAGRYVGDLAVEGLLHLAVVRSTFAHANITGVDTSEAAKAPGVVAVFTGADLGVEPFHPFMALNEAAARPPLATDRVRFVGEGVAAVVAERPAQATDAAELVMVDYEPLDAVAHPEAALAPDAPRQFDAMDGNFLIGFKEGGDAAVLEGADVVVRARMENQRVAVTPMEPNAIVVVPEPDDEGHELTVYVSTQMPHGVHSKLCEVFGLERDAVRVVAPWVGGGFGGKPGLAAEYATAIAVARSLGRPVRWAESRSENTMSMHGRSQVQWAELGLRRDGTFVGMRLRVLGDAGAYAGFGGALPLGPGRTMGQAVYRLPRLAYAAGAVLTNTAPTGAFRGAGRPEAAALWERMVDLAADELDIDPVELRRRNLLTRDQFPYTTATGARYDSGDYQAALDEAVRIVGYDEVRAEQAQRRERGDRWQLGIGVATYVEVTAGGMGKEWGSVVVHPDGTATASAGTSSHGQGHATAFAMLVSDRLGIPVERVRYVQSDTATVPRGEGTGGSRSLQIGGSAVAQAAAQVWELARDLAADVLEAAPDDVVVADGGVAVAGVPASAISWEQLATEAEQRSQPLAAAGDFSQEGPTFPFGAHIAVVEVDTETGEVRLLRHVAVDDCGRVLNPLLVRGQQHGGIAAGAGQALFEHMVYDDEGTPRTPNLADYAMPSAAEFPSFEAATTETPSPSNPLGAKGIGESATIGSTPAVQNAVVDAVSHLGVRHLELPCTPERVWRAIDGARRGDLPDPWRDPPPVFDHLPDRGGATQPEAADVDI